jgi:T4 RnlA family RNA ligase
MLEVQKYLLTHSLDDLRRDHGINVRFSTLNLRKFTLNYDQLEAKDDDPIAQECRGLVLHTQEAIIFTEEIVGETTILAHPMHRFFNYGQTCASKVDLSNPNTKVFEKLDGTLTIVYWDQDLNNWCVATRSVPDADLTITGYEEHTFSSLFWKTFEVMNGRKDALVKGYTYCFELCTPENWVVVKHTDYKLWLLAVRNHNGLEEMCENHFDLINIPAAPSYWFNDFDSLVEFVNNRNGKDYEGVVVMDVNFNRVKVKNTDYVSLSKVKDSVVKSPRALLTLILNEKEDDVIGFVPEFYQNKIQEVKAGIQNLIHSLDKEYEELWCPDRKQFAQLIQINSGMLGPQMMRWSGRVSGAHDWIIKSKKNGKWSDSFLDELLRMSKKF